MNNQDYFIGKVKLNLKYYNGQDLYSDGPIEDELLEIARDYSRNEYDTVISERDSWPIFYHFSSLRGNILSGVGIKKTDSVLEIGSGCGGITASLSTMCKQLTCVELSQKRSMINAERNRECDNIEIYVGNFADIEPDLPRQYDVITLIGVLEYAGLYIQSERPFEDFLKIISKHLKSDGKIVIAIENKMGLKYWAGAKEDHTGLLFDGIQGYQNESGVRTFSMPELKRLLTKVGLVNVDFGFPYPDYKLPSQIYTFDTLPKIGEINGNTPNYDNKRLQLFNEANVFDELISDEMFPYFSNSFLVVAGLNQSSDVAVKPFLCTHIHAISTKSIISLKEAIDATRKNSFTIQVFWDEGKGFSESCSIFTDLKYVEDKYVGKIILPTNVCRFRIDTGDKPCALELHLFSENMQEILPTEHNGAAQGQMVLFNHNDPWFVFDTKQKTVVLEMRYYRKD